MRASALATACLALAICATVETVSAPAAVAGERFGIVPGSFNARTCAAAELTCTGSSAPETQAAAHPTGTISFALNSQTVTPQPAGTEGALPAGQVKDVIAQLPPGLAGNPEALPRCPHQMLHVGCPRDTMVGYAVLTTATTNLNTPGNPTGTLVTPIFNLVPAPGTTAQFGFIIVASTTLMSGSVRTDGDFGLTVAVANILGGTYVKEVATTFWGVPAEHNGPGSTRVTSQGSIVTIGGPGSGPRTPFLRNPSDCSSGPLTTRLYTDSWEDPGTLMPDGEPNPHDAAWGAATASSPQPTGCEGLAFGPSLELHPATSEIDTPSGYEVTLAAPQSETPGGIGEADLRDVKVTLPTGMSVDPSAADGLAGCTDSEYGYGTNTPVSCPAGAQIGEVEVETPLLAPHSLTGQVYLGTPLSNDPQSGEMYRLFLVLNGPGLLIKIHGSAVADPTTGQLTATFPDNPPLPFSELKLRLNGGERAPLANPAWCETTNVTGELGSFAGETIAWSDPISFNYDGGGGPCPQSIPFSPSFTAGTLVPLAATFSPFTLGVARADRQQALSRIETMLPRGLMGVLKTVPLCREPEATAGTCPPASRIGTVTTGVGPGPHPFYVSGAVYLTGPYAGAPFGLSVAIPAVAGPFDLGTVVVRAAISVDPATAAVSVISDPLPQVLSGIPLRIRSVTVTVDRSGFIFNPTSCTGQSVTATISAAQGARSAASTPFDVGGCQNLPFQPTFAASTEGHSSKANGASLDVELAQGPGQANIHKVEVSLPRAMPSRLSTLQKACTERQFAVNPAGCPEGSVVGSAIARTPVLSGPLSGPAYLVSHAGAAFPDLDIVLQGEGVTIVLTGNTDIKKGITYSRFQTLPDAPISSFELKLPESPHSALGATGSLCKQRLAMGTTLVGQNGAELTQSTKVAVLGCPPTLLVKLARVTRKAVLLSVRTSASAIVTAGGRGLRTVRKTLAAGAHVITVPLTAATAGARRSRKRRIEVSARNPQGSTSRTLVLELPHVAG